MDRAEIDGQRRRLVTMDDRGVVVTAVREPASLRNFVVDGVGAYVYVCERTNSV